MIKYAHTFILIFLLSIQGIYAQEISLEKLYSGYYSGRGISGVSSMKDGEHYTVQDREGIAKYSYQTNEKIGYVVKGLYADYQFSEDESKLLLLKDMVPIYRHSYLGLFEVKDLKTGKTILLNNGKMIQEPLFSPDGHKIAFVYENNMYYQDLETGEITAITTDGKKNEIINGLSDWVYEEEFGHARQFNWTKNSDAIVFIRFDESQVKEVTIPIYGESLYPSELKYKYPKAGENNSVVTAYSYRLGDSQPKKIDLSGFKHYYIPNIFSTNKADEIVTVTSERTQNASDVLKVNTKTGKVTKLFTETDPQWIDNDNVTLAFLEDNSFLWASERDGYRHLYWYSPNGQLKKQVTQGKWEVTDFYGYSPKDKAIHVQTTQNGSTNRVVAKVNIKNSKSTILSASEGTNSASFSKNFTYFIETSSSAIHPAIFTLKDASGKTLKVLEDNNEQATRLKQDRFSTKEFFTIKNEAGLEMNAWIMKPQNFDSSKKYPVLMYQYSGPGSQQVANSWDVGNGVWFSLLNQKGYLVVCVDGRGTGYKGTAYKKVTYKNLGHYEIQDQIAAAKWLAQQSYVDAKRIGIFGWSFGGYISSLAMTKGADVFSMGIAVAPVTNWRFYDSVYTERFLGTPQENPKGYDDNSPTTYASELKGKFLMIHGTADDNVHFQNAMRFSEALIQNNKQFDFMAYPDKNHGIYGGYTRIQLYTLMTNYILKNL